MLVLVEYAQDARLLGLLPIAIGSPGLLEARALRYPAVEQGRSPMPSYSLDVVQAFEERHGSPYLEQPQRGRRTRQTASSVIARGKVGCAAPSPDRHERRRQRQAHADGQSLGRFDAVLHPGQVSLTIACWA